MNNETSFIPIYIKLFERNSKAVEQLTKDVKSLSIECAIEDDVVLSHITKREANSSIYMVVYRIDTKPTRQRHSNSVGMFLDKIFSQLADKHPTYAEPQETVERTP